MCAHTFGHGHSKLSHARRASWSNFATIKTSGENQRLYELLFGFEGPASLYNFNTKVVGSVKSLGESGSIQGRVGGEVAAEVPDRVDEGDGRADLVPLKCSQFVSSVGTGAKDKAFGRGSFRTNVFKIMQRKGIGPVEQEFVGGATCPDKEIVSKRPRYSFCCFDLVDPRMEDVANDGHR